MDVKYYVHPLHTLFFSFKILQVRVHVTFSIDTVAFPSPTDMV